MFIFSINFRIAFLKLDSIHLLAHVALLQQYSFIVCVIIVQINWKRLSYIYDTSKDSQWTESTQERVLLTLGCDLPSSSASGKHSKGLAPLEKRTTVKHIKDLCAWGFIRVNMSKMSKRYIWMISKKKTTICYPFLYFLCEIRFFFSSYFFKLVCVSIILYQNLRHYQKFLKGFLTWWEFEMSLDVLKPLLYGCISTVSGCWPLLRLPSISPGATSLGPVSVYYSCDCPAIGT